MTGRVVDPRVIPPSEGWLTVSLDLVETGHERSHEPIYVGKLEPSFLLVRGSDSLRVIP